MSDQPSTATVLDPEQSAPADQAETKPVAPSKRDNLLAVIAAAEEKIAEAQNDLAAFNERGLADKFPKMIKLANDAIAASEKERDQAKAQLANIDRTEKVEAVSAPILKALGTFKIAPELAESLPSSVHLDDGVKIKADAEDLERKAKALKGLGDHLAKAVERITVEYPDDLPPLSLTKGEGGVITFAFAARAAARAPKGEGKGGPRMGRGAYQIVSVPDDAPESVKALSGQIVGNHERAVYKSWEEMFKAVAPQSEIDRIGGENQSRSKHEWLTKSMGAVTQQLS